MATDIRMTIDQEMYEFVGQVKNFPPARPGLPATSVQYGYISHVAGLSDDQIYVGVLQNEASALLTFYNQLSAKRNEITKNR